MGREDYERTLARLEICQKIAEPEAEIKNGEELIDGIEVFKKLSEEYIRDDWNQ
ncbi:MAG: hypothetical protein K0M69_11330 [Youngiibacter sp.]|nr:hypothetical protein [Youngiibacter sp.]